MLTVLSDTHGTDDPRLRGRTLEAVREADLVVHAGDFSTERVLDAFVAESARLFAVYGNTDDLGIRSRLPKERAFAYGGVRFALTHTRRGGPTALALFGRERGADTVVFGHSHRPTVERGRGVLLLNPGSHAEPRGHRAGHAELEPVDGGLDGRLVGVDGEVVDRFRLAASSDTEG